MLSLLSFIPFSRNDSQSCVACWLSVIVLKEARSPSDRIGGRGFAQDEHTPSWKILLMVEQDGQVIVCKALNGSSSISLNANDCACYLLQKEFSKEAC